MIKQYFKYGLSLIEISSSTIVEIRTISNTIDKYEGNLALVVLSQMKLEMFERIAPNEFHNKYFEVKAISELQKSIAA